MPSAITTRSDPVIAGSTIKDRQCERPLRYQDLVHRNGMTLLARKCVRTSKIGSHSARLYKMRNWPTTVRAHVRGVVEGMSVPETVDLDWDKIDGYRQRMCETAARIGGASIGAATPGCSEALAPEASLGANDAPEGLVRIVLGQSDANRCFTRGFRQKTAGRRAVLTDMDLAAKDRKTVRSEIGAEKSPSVSKDPTTKSEAPKGPFNEIPQPGAG